MFWRASLLSLALPAYAAVHESIAAAPAGWRELATSDSQSLTLQVALQHQNLDQLDSKLHSIATPGSAEYGKWLSKDDVDALFAPSSDSVEKVKSWLAGAGVSSIDHTSDILTFRTTVGAANKLLDAKFTRYTDDKTLKLRTLQYSIPDELKEHIDLVSPTTFFGQTKAHAVAAPPPAAAAAKRAEMSFPQMEVRQLKHSCEKNVVFENITFPLIGPDCLKELYNVGNYTADPTSGASIAFGNFLNQSASYSDLAKFEKIYSIPNQTFSILAEINGGVNDQNPLTEMDGEANLDVQNMMGLVHPMPIGAFITGGSPPFHPDLLSPNASENENEPYLPYYQYILSQENSALPQVISNSYGDHENTVPYYYAKRVCNMIGMVGLRGISILESSGDEGTGAVCLTNGKGKPHAEFTPQFPGTCPYVTAVGGTQFYNPEAAWNASSGGFSFYFPQPYYQADAVATYLADGISAATKEYYSSNDYVNFSGRGFPDVSAHSLYPFYLTVINGTAEPNGGTSAASPVVASIVALLNDALFRAGKPQLGFLNPWLYSTAASAGALNDITTGGSLGCAGVDLQSGVVIKGAGIIPYASWNATEGWDPVTGLGTPNFQALKALVLGSSASSYGR